MVRASAKLAERRKKMAFMDGKGQREAGRATQKEGFDHGVKTFPLLLKGSVDRPFLLYHISQNSTTDRTHVRPDLPPLGVITLRKGSNKHVRRTMQRNGLRMHHAQTTSVQTVPLYQNHNHHVASTSSVPEPKARDDLSGKLTCNKVGLQVLQDFLKSSGSWRGECFAALWHQGTWWSLLP